MMRYIQGTCVVLSLWVCFFTAVGHAFTPAENQRFTNQCLRQTQQKGYNLQASQAYCGCYLTKTTAFMMRNNLKQGVPAPPGKALLLTQELTSITQQCYASTLAQYR